MKKVFKKVAAVLMAAILIVMMIPSVFAGSVGSVNKFNVVFVVDASYSLVETDPAKNRFESLDLFLGMLANEGNYVGAVSFNDTFDLSDFNEINGNKSKKALSERIRKNSAKGDTDIGGALLQAVDMLGTNGNPDLESIIILLSDGNTDMDTAELQEKSLSDKAEAIEQARDAGYKIYTVFLNSNKTGDPKEIEQIARATGGEYEEVSKPSDLSNVFEKFYSQIYGTKSLKLVDENVPSNGKISESVSIKGVGIEEVNIAVFGDVKSISITAPDRKVIDKKELNDLTYTTENNSFKLVKLIAPEAGKWKVAVNAVPGSKVKIVKSYNTNLSMATSLDTDEFKVGSPITVSVSLAEGDKTITDTEDYKAFDATLTITDYDGNKVDKITPDTVDENGYKFIFTPESINSFYGKVVVSGEEVHIESEKLIFDVENNAPYAVDEVVKKHVNIWPFLIKTDASVDLSSCAKDNEDETLTYKIKSSTWDEEEYTLEDNVLTVNSFKNYSKGSFEVQAVDSMGAFCTVNIKYTSANIGLITMLVLLLGLLVALALFGFITYRQIGKPFMGDITVTNVASPELTYKQTKNRGRIKLSNFLVGDTGFHKGTYFQACGKEFVYLVSSKKMYSDQIFKPSKKIKVDTAGITIYSDANKTKGINVKFVSMNNNSEWF